MKWTLRAERLYQKILGNSIAQVPLGFRKLARVKADQYESEIRQKVEEKAKEKGSEAVGEEEMVEAIKQFTPPEKKKIVIRILKDSGVDVNKYFKKTEIFQALY